MTRPVGLQVWVILMGWRLREGGHEGASWNVREVKHKATLDGHNSSIFRTEFLKGDESTKTL